MVLLLTASAFLVLAPPAQATTPIGQDGSTVSCGTAINTATCTTGTLTTTYTGDYYIVVYSASASVNVCAAGQAPTFSGSGLSFTNRECGANNQFAEWVSTDATTYSGTITCHLGAASKAYGNCAAMAYSGATGYDAAAPCISALWTATSGSCTESISGGDITLALVYCSGYASGACVSGTAATGWTGLANLQTGSTCSTNDCVGVYAACLGPCGLSTGSTVASYTVGSICTSSNGECYLIGDALTAIPTVTTTTTPTTTTSTTTATVTTGATSTTTGPSGPALLIIGVIFGAFILARHAQGALA